MKEHFARRNIHTIDTGIKHGTITVDMGSSGMFEVTTFRVDGDYSDNRHPDSVRFTRSIHQDLSRRDFTVNAMAFNQAGLVDPFHGKEDLKNKVISCVGNPDERFSEDALRILRALRFASVYQFRIDGRTTESIHKNKHKLKHIAAERICSELCKMLKGKGILDVLLAFGDVFAFIIPELAPCVGFAQNNRFHQYTVYEHIARAVASYNGGDTSVNMALLLHDIGKPLCYTEDENGGHFYGHAKCPKKSKYHTTLQKIFKNHKRGHTQSQCKHHIMCLVSTIQQVPGYFTDYGKAQQGKEIPVPAAGMNKPFRYQKGKHWKSDAPDTAHRSV